MPASEIEIMGPDKNTPTTQNVPRHCVPTREYGVQNAMDGMQNKRVPRVPSCALVKFENGDRADLPTA